MFSLDFVQLLKYFLTVWVLPWPNLQHRDATEMTSTGAEQRLGGDGGTTREELFPERGTLS